MQFKSQMQDIKSIEELLNFLKKTEEKVFYLGPIYGTTVLSVHDFMPSFEIIACNDPYFGALPFVTVPESFKGHECSGIACQHSVANNPEALAYMRSKDPNPNVMFMVCTEETDRICKENGLRNWGSSIKLHDYLSNKVKVLDLLRRADIPFIPNVCSKIESYQHLLQLTSQFASPSLVIQDQMGIGGYGTMFINSEDDYEMYQGELQSGKAFKIMGFRQLKCLTVDAVCTRAGTFVSPVLADLIGHKELTNCPGGYCGNELRRSYFGDPVVDAKVRREILKLTEKFGNYLYVENLFKGFFGCDFAVDINSHEVFFLEINARLTGTEALTSMVYEAQGHRFPQVLYHLAEHMGVGLHLDVEAINNEWAEPQHYQKEVSYLLLRPFESAQVSIPYSFPAGFWTFEKDELKFTGKVQFRLSQLKDNEIYFTPNKGFAMGNIILRKLVQDKDFKLTSEAKVMIDKFFRLRLEGKPN